MYTACITPAQVNMAASSKQLNKYPVYGIDKGLAVGILISWFDAQASNDGYSSNR